MRPTFLSRAPRCAAFAALLLAVTSCQSAEEPSADPGTEVLAPLHQRALVADLHNDIAIRLMLDDDYDFGAINPAAETDLPRLRKGGIDAQVFAVWIDGDDYPGESAWVRTLEVIDRLHQLVADYPDDLSLARSATEVREAATTGRIAVLLAVEGGYALGQPTDEATLRERLDLLAQRDVTYLTLAWIKSTFLAGSSGDDGGGLTDLGRVAVRHMNDLGMIVDVSHLSDQAVREVLDLSRAPVIASHSALRALCDIPRNLGDDLLKEIAADGGLVGINFAAYYIDCDFERRAEEMLDGHEEEIRTLTEAVESGTAPPGSVWELKRRLARRMPGRTPLEQLVEHFLHGIDVAGVDALALGSDFDGVLAVPEGLDDVSHLPDLTRELQERGVPDSDLEKILGSNLLRVMEAVAAEASPRSRNLQAIMGSSVDPPEVSP